MWIGTADIKDLYVKKGHIEMPFLSILSDFIGQGVEVRLIHAKETGPNFKADFNRYPRLKTMLERVLCPRVHFKIIVIDQKIYYIGSANLTGAGKEIKSLNRRNFETGILTDIPDIEKVALKNSTKCGEEASVKSVKEENSVQILLLNFG